MTEPLRLLVFSDLDGTLIDHETYSWSAATGALEALRAFGAGLVLASSKTAPEIAAIRADIGFEDWPSIVENGAGILPAGEEVVADAQAYGDLRRALDAVPADLRQQFTGFGDLSAAEVAQCTGLSPEAATLAKDRGFSEPGTWSGSDAEQHAFVDHLGASGIIAQRGGRFLTLSFGGNKADQVKTLTETFTPAHTLALGDAPNDIAMIEAAASGVIIANPHGAEIPPLDGEATGRIRRTTASGPQGWNTAVLSLLDTLNAQS